MGLGCVKTQTCCGDENSVLKRRMFFSSRARPASRRPPMQRRRNIENLAVPTLPVRSSRLAFHATLCRTVGDLEACWNRKGTGAERSSPTRRYRHAYGAQQGRQPLRPGVWTRRGLLMFCSGWHLFHVRDCRSSPCQLLRCLLHLRQRTAPVGRMWLVRFAFVDQRQHRAAAQGFGAVDLRSAGARSCIPAQWIDRIKASRR
jgi:hypothetical protein